MKLDTEQEIMNLKAVIEDREEEIATKYHATLIRKYLCKVAKLAPLKPEGVISYD